MSKLLATLRRLRSNAPAFQLPFPVPPGLRVAQLGDGPLFAGIHPLKAERAVELEAYRPQVIVARAKQMRMLAEQIDLHILELSSVDHAVVVLTECGAEPLTDVARVVLWQTFAVPVFEIYTGLDHSVLAAECELHEGWHLEPKVQLNVMHGELVLDAPGNSGLRTGLAGRIDEEPCPCGRVTPRLLNVLSVTRQDASTLLAAIA